MLKISFYAFIVWFLLLPFTIISSVYLGMAVDKILSPILLLLWAALFLMGEYRLEKRKILLLLFAFGFFFIRNVSFISNSSVYLELILDDAIRFGYFALPILFINTSQKIKPATRLVSINAAAGCVSVFLVAFGLLTLPYERFSQSRIGLEDIQKSIGLFSAYGDLAQYAAYFLLLALVLPSNLFSNKKRLVQFTVILIVIMGLIGTQSRSYLLSIITSVIAATVFIYRSKKTTNITLINILIVIMIIILLAVTGFMFNDIVNSLMGLGGSQASKTAQGRLEQYQFAFALIKEYPIFGVDAEFYLKNGSFGHFVHNMWLGQLVRGGFSSALMLFGLLLFIFRRSMMLLSSEYSQPYAIVSIGYLSALFVSTLFYPADSMIFWVMLGMNSAIVFTISPEMRSKGTVGVKKHQNDKRKSSILKYKDSNAR